MVIEKILGALRLGKMLRRISWQSGWYLIQIRGRTYQKYEDKFFPYERPFFDEEIMKDDWEVLDD